MNIVKIENFKSAFGFDNKVEIKADKRDTKKEGVMVVLSDEDIENINSLVKLRGYSIYVLLIPKKYKFTFNDSDYGKNLRHQFIPNVVISYY